MDVQIKLLNDKAVMPKYAKAGDAGLDLTSTEYGEGNGYIFYKTGLSISIPDGYMGLLFPRSSISNTSLILANSVGIIDSKFRGEIEVRFKQFNSGVIYAVGERVAQLIIIPYPNINLIAVDELPQEGNRGGGYGSTGK